VTGAHRRADVVEELERLRHDHAVEGIRRDVRRVGEIADEGRARIRIVDVEDVSLRHAAFAEDARVIVVFDLEHVSADIVRVRAQELLDVIAIDRPAAIEAVLRAERRGALEIADVHAFLRPHLAQALADAADDPPIEELGDTFSHPSIPS
jgi:hypothetical protein